jgi:hypothetical protein
MDFIDIILMCIYTPFALAALWVVGCLFFRRTDLVPRFIARWFYLDNSSKDSRFNNSKETGYIYSKESRS